jgi:hypothetical protein
MIKRFFFFSIYRMKIVLQFEYTFNKCLFSFGMQEKEIKRKARM